MGGCLNVIGATKSRFCRKRAKTSNLHLLMSPQLAASRHRCGAPSMRRLAHSRLSKKRARRVCQSRRGAQFEIVSGLFLNLGRTVGTEGKRNG